MAQKLPKLVTYVLPAGQVTTNSEAEAGDDVAVTLHGRIVKDGKVLKGNVKLSVSQIQRRFNDEGWTISADEDGTVTITVIEMPQGRKTATGEDIEDVSEFAAKFLTA